MKTYSILDGNYETLYSTTSFNQEVLTAEFEKYIRNTKEGDEVMFGFSTDTHMFAPELVVEIKKGEPMLQIYKGMKTYYKSYSFQTAA